MERNKSMKKFLELRKEFWELYHRARKVRRRKDLKSFLSRLSRILADMRYVYGGAFSIYVTSRESEALKQLTKGGDK